MSDVDTNEWQPKELNAAQDALDRMRRAHQRGTGCRLTPQMIDSLAVTHIGEMWEEDRPETDSD